MNWWELLTALSSGTQGARETLGVLPGAVWGLAQRGGQMPQYTGGPGAYIPQDSPWGYAGGWDRYPATYQWQPSWSGGFAPTYGQQVTGLPLLGSLGLAGGWGYLPGAPTGMQALGLPR